jgi:tight adherence protein B
MSFLVFAIAFFASLACYLVISSLLDRRVHVAAVRRLAAKAPLDPGARRVDPLLMQTIEAQGKMATRLLDRFKMKPRIEGLLESSAVKWGAVGVIHRAAGLFIAAFLATTVATGNQTPLAAIAAGAAASSLPIVYLRRKSQWRIRRFEEQFADCLEFISRSMRAGHAFSVSLELVHKEFTDPLAGEFRRIYEEQNLGQPLEIVLRKLSSRIPSMDVHFFVSAVLLQKRTGGNLAELLDKLAQIIRERFKLRARVRAISAQGLMSGRILAAIPLAVAVLMFVVNNQYARFFLDDPVGHQLVAGAVCLESLGYLIIKKIVVIEV